MNSSHKNISLYDTDQTDVYQCWRQWKLDEYKRLADDFIVDIINPLSLKDCELTAIAERLLALNYVIYRLRDSSTLSSDALKQMTRQLGLHVLDDNLCAEDSISHITAAETDSDKSCYIPYTRHALSWHTDGYYNPADKTIHSLVLHCNQPAEQGGINGLLDHEIAYILLADINPIYVQALYGEDVMTIPANIKNGVVLREHQSGPVFSINDNGRLHMRYSARKHNIIWKEDTDIQTALSALTAILKDESSPWIKHYQLKTGEGLLCNNVLHNRSAYKDRNQPGSERYFLRGRSYHTFKFRQLDSLQTDYSFLEF